MNPKDSAIKVPACFQAELDQDVFFHAYSNEGRPVRSCVDLSHHLLSLVQEGEKEVIVADRCAKVDGSQLVLLSATTGIMSEHNLKGRPMRSLLLFFTPRFLVEFCARHDVRPGKETSALLSLPQDPYIRHFARSVELFGIPALNTSALAHTKAEEVLSYLRARQPAAFASFVAASLKGRDELSLRTVVAHHQDGNLTVPELAFLCHMSVSTFKRRFHEVFGEAPGHYLQRRRMERAKAMLERDLRPSEIYHLVGYESLAAFSAGFKKHFGVPPSALH